MDTIILRPKTKEETSFYEYLAKTLRTPYQIKKVQIERQKKKPSDFFGTLSKEEGEKMHVYIDKSRQEWQRDF